MAFTKSEFEEIYKRCFSQAMRLAMRFVYAEEDARDIVQQVFMNLWESEKRVENPDSFVYRSVRNRCLNHIRRLDNHERIKKLYIVELDTYSDDIDEEIGEVQQAVKNLTLREQEVVEEVFSKGSSYKEAASNLRISVSTVNKHIVNALRSLRMLVKKH